MDYERCLSFKDLLRAISRIIYIQYEIFDFPEARINLLDISSIWNYHAVMKTPEQIVSVISRIHENANRVIIDELAFHGMEGLVPSHGDILSCLFRNDGVPMSELARKIGRKKNTVTVLVEKLETFGYVTRVTDREDSRISLVYLTAKGKSIENRFAAISDKLIAAIYKGISGEEKIMLLDILERMEGNLRAGK